ncbi:MAG: hypothetical protein GYB58_20220 [Gammaproteobacteria bacterium]|nr:hypothetical protein [Gammaproteobacteria bacterium]
MTKFESECYDALNRLIVAAKNGSKNRITYDAVSVESGRASGAGSIRRSKHPQLCKDIIEAENQRRLDILALSQEEQSELNDILKYLNQEITLLRDENEVLKSKILKQSTIMLNLLHDLDEASLEIEYLKNCLK